MKEQSRRLQRVEDKLGFSLPVGNGGAERHMHFLMVNLPTFEAAVARAKACGARTVVWVPLQGEVQCAEWEHTGRNIPADVLAFEGPFATLNQIRRLATVEDPSCAIEDDDTKIGGHSRSEGYGGHPPPEQPPPAGQRERVDFMEGDRCIKWMFLSPEELPR